MTTVDAAQQPPTENREIGTVLSPWFGNTSGRMAIAVLIWIGVCIAWTFIKWGGDGGRSVFGIFYDLPIGPLIVYLAWRASRHPTLDRRARRGWTLIAVSFVFYWLGNQTWNIYESILKIEPWPSLADAFWLLFYPIIFAGLIQLSEPLHGRREQVKFALDAATVMVAGTALIWYFVLSSIPIDPEQSALEVSILMAYPVGDLLLAFGTICVLLKRQAARHNPAILLILIGQAVVFTGDMLFLVQTAEGTYETGGMVDVCFLVWFAFMILASHVQHVRSGSVEPTDFIRRPYPFRLSPYVAVVAGYALLVYDHIARGGYSFHVPLITAVVLSFLIIVRQILAAREIAALHAQQAQRKAEERFTSLVKHSSDMVLVTDPDGMIRLATQAVERVLGWEAATLVGSHLAALLHHDDVPAMQQFCRQAASTPGVTAPVEWRFRNQNGTWQNAEVIGSNLLHDGSVGGLVLNCRDITERKLLEEQLKHLAFHDPLTLLANRNLLNDRLQRALASAETSDLLVAVMFVDLDNFKKINDSLGHDMGDELLVTVAERFNRAIRPSDTVARLGGDEFAILLEDARSAEDVMLLARRLIETMKAPIDLGTKRITVTGSVGIAIASKGERAQELMRNADVAMYRAKGKSRGSYELFEAKMHTKLVESMEVELDLRNALQRGEFVLNYQPIIDLRSNHVVGMETLVRWRHPQRGLVPPAAFIPIAEESDLIINIGRWVLFETCLQGRVWQDTLPPEDLQHLAVNISGHQLQQPGFVEEVSRILLQTGVNPKTLVLELTESVVMQDVQVTLAKLRALKELGVSLAMDDFGTGYSSLSYLHQFPFDILKIDRSFINQIGDASGSNALVRTIVALGQTLGLKMVAEGIESPAELAELKHLGCAYGQGFLFGKPGTAEEASATLASPRVNPSLTLVRTG
ncbi:MAG: putative bifunctional diguanylate cyclase/phosphodiesterase [Chromatiales bacterium]